MNHEYDNDKDSSLFKLCVHFTCIVVIFKVSVLHIFSLSVCACMSIYPYICVCKNVCMYVHFIIP